jgi:glycosyltransferase involved in cell wall biosynthesis
MRIALATICLNESEFIAKSYEQHSDWPGLISWVFVEGADRAYARANPGMVSHDGLSTDQTCPIITSLSNKDAGRIKLVRHGWMEDGNPSQAKTRGRDRYLDVFETVQPDFFVVLDADEFYTREDQLRINRLLEADTKKEYLCWRLTQRHVWRPHSIRSQPLFNLEANGGYWAVRHIRIFRWQSGLRYKLDHNYPQSASYRPLRHIYDGSTDHSQDPHCVHLGFARSAQQREATNRYYVERGESNDGKRSRYVQCRTAWERWKPNGKRLPNGAYITDYSGPIPECFNHS